MPRKTAPKRKPTAKNKAARAKTGSTLGPSVIHRKLKLSQHQHTFKRLPTRHTSRGALVVLSLASCFLFIYVTKSYSANAAALTGSGSLGLSGLVRPTTAASLDKPLNTQIFSTKQISVSGSCPTIPPQNVVKIIDNGIVGITTCNDGLYQLKVDLFPGVNFLRARISDIYNHDGPDSTVIRVYYSPAGGSGSSASAFNIGVNSDVFTVAAGHSFKTKILISSGQAPYAINVNWGDGSSDLISAPAAGGASAQHAYQGGGQYQIKINASDSAGRKAYAEMPVLVSGPTATAVGLASSSSGNTSNQPYGLSTLKKIEPVYVAVSSAVFVFWAVGHLGHIGLSRTLRFPRFRH